MVLLLLRLVVLFVHRLNNVLATYFLVVTLVTVNVGIAFMHVVGVGLLDPLRVQI